MRRKDLARGEDHYAPFQQITNWSPGYINVAPANLDIMAECTACGQSREFFKRSLPDSLWHALISDIEARMKCSACGAKAGKLKFGYLLREE